MRLTSAAERGSGEEFIPMLLSNHSERDESGAAERIESTTTNCSSPDRLQLITCINDGGSVTRGASPDSGSDVMSENRRSMAADEKQQSHDAGDVQSQTSGKNVMF